jgi:pimeloyl-ACP methyl ester carboxylesterase
MPDLRYRTNNTVAIGDRSIYFEKLGPVTETTLVFVNNFFIVAPMWRNYIAQISSGHSCLIYDLENQGGSSLRDEPTIDSHAETLRQLLDVLDVRNVVLVGTSTSALICARYAQQDRVRGLILAGPSMTPSNELVRKATERTLLNSLRLGGTEALWDHLYALSFSGQMMKELGATGYLGLRAAFAAVHRRDPMLANMAAAHRDGAAFSVLAELGAPVQLILGTADSLWSGNQVDEINAAVNGKEIFVEQLVGAGHLPYMEDPDGFQKAILTFLEREGIS